MVAQRLHFALQANFGGASAHAPRTMGEKEEVVLHINPIAYTELRYILEKYGFTLAGAYRDKPKPNLWLYWPLRRGDPLLCTLLTPERKRRERWTKELASDAVLLGGNTRLCCTQ